MAEKKRRLEGRPMQDERCELELGHHSDKSQKSSFRNMRLAKRSRAGLVINPLFVLIFVLQLLFSQT